MVVKKALGVAHSFGSFFSGVRALELCSLATAGTQENEQITFFVSFFEERNE